MGLVAEGRGDTAFTTLFDFACRVDLKRVGKRPLEMLAPFEVRNLAAIAFGVEQKIPTKTIMSKLILNEE